MQRHIVSVLHRPATILLTALAAAALMVAGSPPSANASNPGDVLYSPDLSSDPDGTAGYPRAVTLGHNGGNGDTVIATFAKSATDTAGSLPVYRSTDAGEAWSQISEITSNTPGWDIEAPTLFEVPRDIPGLAEGDILAAGTAWKVGDYTAQKVEVFRSSDGGESWSYLSDCTSTSGLPDEIGHGIWEPSFLVADDGTLACFISDERPADSATNNQQIGHYTSSDGGKTWSSEMTVDIAYPEDPLARPGMQTFASLPDGRTAMSFELCRDATDPDHACDVYVTYSDDGLTWDDERVLVQTSDDRELLHTPSVSWIEGGGAEGTLLLSGQRVVAGPTGNKTVLEETGTVMLANTSGGTGDWTEISTPVTVDPTGGYNDGEASCPGYSTPAVPLSDGTSYLYFAATWLGSGNKCEIRFATGSIPDAHGAITGPDQKCLDVDTNTSVNGNAAQLYSCGPVSGQDWSVQGDGTIRALGKCLDVDAQGTANFTPVQLWECNESGAQQWVARDDGSLLNPQSGRCLDVPEGVTADGTRLQIYDCNGEPSQRWALPA